MIASLDISYNMVEEKGRFGHPPQILALSNNNQHIASSTIEPKQGGP